MVVAQLRELAPPCLATLAWRERLQQPRQRDPGVTEHPDVRLVSRGEPVRARVEGDQGRGSWHRPVAGHRTVERGADRHHQVGRADVRRHLRLVRREADQPGMAGREHASPGEGGDHGGAEQLGECGDLLLGVRLDHTTAGPDDDARGRVDRRDSACHRLRVRLPTLGAPRLRGEVGLLIEHVGGDVEVHRSAGPGERDRDRIGDRPHRVVGGAGPEHGLGQWLEECCLVTRLVEHAAHDPGPSQPGRDLAGHEHHGAAGGGCLTEGAHGVRSARAGRGESQARAHRSSGPDRPRRTRPSARGGPASARGRPDLSRARTTGCARPAARTPSRRRPGRTPRARLGQRSSTWFLSVGAHRPHEEAATRAARKSETRRHDMAMMLESITARHAWSSERSLHHRRSVLANRGELASRYFLRRWARSPGRAGPRQLGGVGDECREAPPAAAAGGSSSRRPDRGRPRCSPGARRASRAHRRAGPVDATGRSSSGPMDPRSRMSWALSTHRGR